MNSNLALYVFDPLSLTPRYSSLTYEITQLVIAVTGNARDGQKRECIDSGFDEVSFSSDDMLSSPSIVSRD